MQFFRLTLETLAEIDLSEQKRCALQRLLDIRRERLKLESTIHAYSGSRYAESLQTAEIEEKEQRARSGWWDERKCGAIPFQDVPVYRFRSQDLQISPELVARDRAEEKKEALQKRQAAWNRARRAMATDWRGSLTRNLKSG